MATTGPQVTLRLPSVLHMIAGASEVRAHGSTIAEVLASVFESVPLLERHLIDAKSGQLRPHVLCVVNGAALLREEVADARLADGDEILIHQAISGG